MYSVVGCVSIQWYKDVLFVFFLENFLVFRGNLQDPKDCNEWKGVSQGEAESDPPSDEKPAIGIKLPQS